ncbi:MAG: hypothetical protein HYZ50_12360, partial [Deltaproteobacteria bacterium]|nr:hypothetical protein [Deltaproteobacteria bacterium]
RHYDRDSPISLDNEEFSGGITRRSIATIGPGRTDPRLLSRPGGIGDRAFTCIQAGQAGAPTGPQTAPCLTKRLADLADFSFVNTLSISTQYLAGNLRPSLVFLYDWSGSWLVQPGVDWTFYDPFRVSVKYNWIDGNYGGIGVFKTKDNVWLELQYLLY